MALKVARTRCAGTMTEAAFRAFVMSAIRDKTKRWAPISNCKKAARTRRGFYRCAECGLEVPASVYGVYKSGKRQGAQRRIPNIVADHIVPIVPVTGWQSWDSVVEHAFCEQQNLQALCKACHDVKTKEENVQRKLHKEK